MTTINALKIATPCIEKEISEFMIERLSFTENNGMANFNKIIRNTVKNKAGV